MALDKVVIDVDEADLSVLDENLKATSELTSQISAALNQAANRNILGVKSVQPLLGRIRQLKVSQKNINSTLGVISNIKHYAKRANDLETHLNEQQDLDGVQAIDAYCNHLSNSDKLLEEIKSANISEYEGILKGLTESIKNSEINLKLGFERKLREQSRPFDPTELLKRQENFPVIGAASTAELIRIASFFESRQKSLNDSVIRHRSKYISESLGRISVTPPPPRKDQNYIYERGTNNINLYTAALTNFIVSEYAVIQNLYPSAHIDFKRAILYEIFKPILGSFVNITSELRYYIEKHKFSEGPLLFEIRKNMYDVVSHIREYIIENVPKEITDIFEAIDSQSQSVYSDFFKYIEARYSEIVFNEHHSSADISLNNVFMAVVSRLIKFSNFRDLQLPVIERMDANSWLPPNRPSGFIEVRVESTDPEYILSGFYGDVLEINYYSLRQKYVHRLSEEDLGVMLLINLDGLDNLLSNKQITSVLGQSGFQRVEKIKKKALEICTQNWQGLTTTLMRAATIDNARHSAMSVKEIIKLIDEFNRNFEEQCRNFNSNYNRLAPHFKKNLVKDISNMIAPAYSVFHANLTNPENSKPQVTKHLKYNSSEFRRKVENLAF
ncbi:hypothetical protein BVG19_g4970 [[Candida] boidinii]|nr:hypothetical protein BVG19_g4970 [[Candida] boidinii]OWB49886.1 hypothetical protein B5S27_g1431 [[Candida] boidinii]OWB82951.1 hypothetical protein B5S33_g1580 [[Candida] boidinii]